MGLKKYWAFIFIDSDWDWDFDAQEMDTTRTILAQNDFYRTTFYLALKHIFL